MAVLAAATGFLSACTPVVRPGAGASSATVGPTVPAGPTTPAPPPVPAVGFSLGELVGPDAAAVARRLDVALDVGASSVRFDLAWSTVQPEPGPRRDWAPVDRVVDAAVARGLHCVAVLGHTPAWARPPGARTSWAPPRDLAAFAAHVGECVRRYGDRIGTWEVWNEPNTRWEPHPDPAAYAVLLRATAAAVRAVDPGSTVLTGGTAPASSDGAGAVSPPDFLRAVVTAGAGDAFDAVAVHPYCFPALPGEDHVWSGWSQMLAVREVLVGLGQGHKDVWATEVGAPTAGRGAGATLADRRSEESPDHGDDAFQAATAGAVFDRWADLPWLRGVHWYSVVDLVADGLTGPTDPTGAYGLVRPDGTEKPAAGVWRDRVRGGRPAAQL